LFIQIGANYANDYSDGLRGADAVRVGPVRLVAGGLASPSAVRNAAWISYAAAGVAGLVLASATTPYLIVIGAVCFAAGWLYSGGPRPYGYAGLGEIFVFVFFGLVAVAGTTYVSLQRVAPSALLAAVPVGLLAVALLVVNNLRDIAGDSLAGKRTLAVRLGERRTRGLYTGCVVAAFCSAAAMAVLRPGAAIALAAVAIAAGPLRAVLGGASGEELIGVLGMTGRLQLAFGLLFAVGIAL
jgi:1,4-dihydroxy-2-naphthoate octaprenyltransferase